MAHAFFKSLLVPLLRLGDSLLATLTTGGEDGWSRKNAVWTAYTMLVGCLAIGGAGIPFVIGLSGYYSKDSIIAQALSFMRANDSPWCGLMFYIAAGGAAVTTFYMFRLWYIRSAGESRAIIMSMSTHESPRW